MANFASDDVISGGTGADVIYLTDAGAIVDASFTNTTNVETLRLTGASTVTLAAKAYAAGVVAIETRAGATDVNNQASAKTINAAAIVDNIDLTLSGTGNNVVNNLEGNIVSTSTGTLDVDFKDIADNAATVQTGTAATTLTVLTGDTVTTDASMMADNIALILDGSGSHVVNNLVSDLAGNTVTGTITVTAEGFGSQNIATGIGDDTINGGKGADVLTGGAGIDRFVYNQDGLASADADNITDFTVGAGGDVFNVHNNVAGYIVANLTAAVVNIAGAANNRFIVDSTNTGYATFALAEAAVDASNDSTHDYVLIFHNTTSGNIEAWADADSNVTGGGVQLVRDFDAANIDTFLNNFALANVSVA